MQVDALLKKSLTRNCEFVLDCLLDGELVDVLLKWSLTHFPYFRFGLWHKEYERGGVDSFHDLWHMECRCLLHMLVNALSRPMLNHFRDDRPDLCHQKCRRTTSTISSLNGGTRISTPCSQIQA